MVSAAGLVSAQAPAIPQAGWTLQFVDSQDSANGNTAVKAFDGNPATFWHTQWSGAQPPPPHNFQVNLGASYAVSGIRYLPRQDAPYGRISAFSVYVSTDGTNWGSAVATGTFQNSTAEQQVLFTAKTGQYLRLTATSEVSGLPYSAIAELNVLGTAQGSGTPPAISRTNWAVSFVDSQDSANGNIAIRAFDGNAATFWHTQWSGAQPAPPHEYQINLGATYQVAGIRYLPRQDAPYGRIGGYAIYVSTDGTNWGSAVAAGTFPNTTAEQQVLFTAKTGQYLRLSATSEVSGLPYSAIAELNVLGTASGNQPPNGTITTPAADVVITPGSSVSFTGSGTDPENNTPLTYAWSFPGGSPSSSTSQNPGAVTYASAGTYTATLTVRDSLTNADPTPATRTVTVQAGGAPTISQAAWTVNVDSQDTANGNTAVKAFDGNPATFWHTQWTGGQPPPPHEFQINLGATYLVSGFRYLPRQDAPYGRLGAYTAFVSPDGINWGNPVAAGTFPNTTAEQQVLFPETTGRFVRLSIATEVSGLPYSAIAEFNVLGTASSNQPPNGTITAPASDVSIAPGGTVSFSGNGSDPDNNQPLSFAWSFPGGSPSSSTNQNPGTVTYATAGVYTATLTVRDSLNNPDPTPATRTITVQGGGTGTGVTLIPQSGWTLRFVDSEEVDDQNGVGRNAFDGNPNTSWITKYTNGGPVPPHEIQIDLGAVYPVTGFRYLPYQLTQAGRVGDYEFYVSTDDANWGSPVAAGAFPDTNSSNARDVYFPAKSGRYIRFRALTEVNNGDYTYNAISELNVLRSGTGTNAAPTVSIASPASNITVVAGSTVALSGTASDPDGNLPLNYQWRVASGAGVADFAGQSPGSVQFDRAGTFTLTFVAIDSLGMAGSTSRTVTVTAGTPLSTGGWSLRYVDSQDSASVATRAFDGNPGTLWATEFASAQPLPPHEIQIDLGSTQDVRGFRYLPRQDGSTVGNIALYRFYVSTDGNNWGDPVAFGLFDRGSGQKEVATIPKRGRYVRLQALNEINGYPYTVVAELSVLTPMCQGVGVTLTQPRVGQIQPFGTLTLSADACLAANQGVRFVVDGSAQTDVFSPPYATVVSGLGLGEHTVQAYVITSGGSPVAGVATYDVATQVAVGGYYVAMGDGMTLGYGDDQPNDDNSADGRNLHGGYTPILADGLAAARGYPVTVVNEGVGSTASINGANSIAALLQKHPNAQYFLVMYGHNDAEDGVPSGRGLSPGQGGYAGSFKDRIQQIVTAVKAAGKIPVLAKAPPILPVGNSWDMAVQQYNFVMDELTASNALPVPAVDFYSYFLSRTDTEYQGTILLNGLGYQSMAQRWLQSLR